MKKNVIAISILSIFLMFCLTACKEKTESSIGADIYRKTLAGVEYCIPKAYFIFPDDPATEGLLIEAMNPNMDPPPNPWNAKGKEYYLENNISILLEPDNRAVPVSGQKFFGDVYELSDKEEFGLQVAMQRPDSHLNDLWLEPGEKLENHSAMMMCGQYIKDSGNKYSPQCSHYFYELGMRFKVSYDRTLLSDWQNIKNNSINLIKNFKCQ